MTMSRTVHASHQVPASGRRCCTASMNGCHSGNRSVSIVGLTVPKLRGEGTVRRGALTCRTTDALGDRGQFGDSFGRSVFGAGHPRDGFLHQRAAQIVRTAVEHHLRALDAEL